MLFHNKIFFGLLTTLMFLVIGTVGYTVLEDYSLLDAFYMTVITISTVGFGEIHTLSEAGRLFTIFLILFGFGSIGFLAHAFTEAIVEKATSKDLGIRTMQKRIQQLTNHVIICGYGRVGAATAEYFHSAGEDFVILESSPDQIKDLESLGYPYLEGDATREHILLSAGIKKAVALLALLDSDPDNLFTVLTARELNPTLHIIARTEVATSESRMLRAGADSIISPHATAGRSVAEKIISSATEEPGMATATIAPGTEPHWIKVTEQSDLAGHVVETARDFLHADILGIRRKQVDLLAPKADEQIELDDNLLIIDHHDGEQQPTCPEAKKLVLVDDNPVICRLYTRLFKKAGFHVLTASNGVEGYNLMLAERPDAAIIDFHLPDMTGLDICARVRQDAEFDNMKLFLFTANDDEATKREAIQAGVDTVVIKGPDASELIKTVRNTLDME